MTPPHLACLALLLSLPAAYGDEAPPGGWIAGQHLPADGLDSAAADWLAQRDVEARPEEPRLLSEWQTDAENAGPLVDLAEDSFDLSTLAFVQGVQRSARHRKTQARFIELFASVDSPTHVPQNLVVVVVPGMAWSSHPEVGADLAGPRRALIAAGFDVRFVATDEYGLVVDNAAVVATVLQHLMVQGRDIVLVSASKGSPEVAHALDTLHAEPGAERIRGWVSVGGIIRGTPLADKYRHGLGRSLATLSLWWSGVPARVLDDLSTEVRRPAFETLRRPEATRVISYIGVPLSPHFTSRARSNGRKLAPLGPNDGLTLLVDELVEGGDVVLDIGLDHYYADPSIDVKTLALARLVLDDAGAW